MLVQKVIVLDFGGQYTHLIARRIRELNVYSEILPYNISLEKLIEQKPNAIILSGGPASIYCENSPKLDNEVLEWIIDKRIPLLGICYGHQLIAHSFGGVVEKGEEGEYGPSILRLINRDTIFNNTPSKQKVWMSHRDYVKTLPEDFIPLASTDYSKIAAFKHRSLPIYGLQFHPEVKHTEYGRAILGNFLYKVSGLQGTWNMANIVKKKIEYIKRMWKGGNVLMAISGGIDSTTTAYLLLKSIGPDNLHLVFVDTGLLRKGEREKVLRNLKKLGFKYLHFIDASSIFLKRLRNVIDPEEKRKIIATTFIEVFNNVREKLEKKYGPFRYLAQGTIYPDRIESGKVGTRSDKIKSHHNVTLPRDIKFKIIEPLSDLYKDEVRLLAKKLGLPEDIVYQHPFPGPGLAVRIIGEVTEEKLRILRRATEIVEEEMKKSGYYRKVWQAFPVLLPFKSVGVMGDSRTYEYAIALRVVESEDAMTADFAKLPWEILDKIASRIVNEIDGVNRVLYDITNKPPATIEYE